MPEKQISRPDGNLSLRNAAMIIPVLVLLLLAGSVLFYKERMLFIDGPHILFRIINDGVLQITEHRYGSFITQMFPLIGAKVHLSLKALMILYSASFNLFFLVVVLLLVYKYREHGLAVLLGLYLTLFASDTFYWPNNEVHQGIAWLFIVIAFNFSIARRYASPFLEVPLFIASFYLAIWTHPLVMLVAEYLWFFYWLDNSNWPYSKSRSILYTVILLALSYWKFYIGQHHGYDSCKIEVVTQFHPGQIKDLFHAPQFRFFVKGCIFNYWLFVLLFAAGIAGLLKERKYRLLALTLAFAAGYCLLLFITFWDIHSNRFYLESEYMPLSVICCAPFVYCVLPKLSTKVSLIILVVIFSIRLGYIYKAAPLFTNRVTILNSINAKMKEKNLTKVIIPDPVAGIDDALIMNWGAPVESIYLSHLHGEVPQRTFIFLAPDVMKIFHTACRDTLLGAFEKRAVSKFNSRYFSMDTTTTYTVISYDSLMK